MSDAMAWAQMARQAQLIGEHEWALRTYEMAIAAGAEGVEVWLGYAMALAQTHHGDSALAAFRKVVESDPQRLDAWCMMGELALDQQRYALAVEAFAHCHKLDPRAEQPHGARAKALTRKTAKELS